MLPKPIIGLPVDQVFPSSSVNAMIEVENVSE